ncbi:MAG: apolipoprotein N-acyltransferase, partial [Chthoniobacterales bacterium]
ADFDAGVEPAVLDLSRVPLRIAPLICFEDTLGELTRKFVARGAQLLVVLTNDGWFRESAGSRQHLANSIFRCVENRRPMVRAANTGVTAFIDPLGRVTEQLESEDGNTFIEGFLSGTIEVPTTPALTFYTRHGEIFSVVCVFAALIAIQIHLVTSRRLTA